MLKDQLKLKKLKKKLVFKKIYKIKILKIEKKVKSYEKN